MKPITAIPPLHWILFAAATMSLGWGLRGFIGGGPLGAMIPGAMIGLALSLLLRLDASQTARLLAFSAVGVGFGGDMTYGQTVGLSFQPGTYWWAILGFAIKGGTWGLLGGAVMGMALAPPSRRMLAATLASMLAATWVGWRLINDPKLIYFSNPNDKPRPEIWAGLILAALTVMALHGAYVRRFAVCGVIGGGIGFALGAAMQVWGRTHAMDYFSDWWKVMEFTFGALLGVGFAWAAWSVEPMAVESGEREPDTPLLTSLTSAALAVAIILALVPYFEERIHIRFSYTVAGALLLLLSTRSPAVAREVGIAVTCCAFFADLYEDRPQTNYWLAVGLIAMATAAIAWFVHRTRCTVQLFLLITWTAVADSLLKSYLPGPRKAAHAVQAIFVVLAVICTLYRHRFSAAAPLSTPPLASGAAGDRISA
ncbi:MAG: hypothetical protein J0L64_20445 [Acidobacteria bacterium]|nr:hypothetical protein [Acidobacteriota bacterium]